MKHFIFPIMLCVSSSSFAQDLSTLSQTYCNPQTLNEIPMPSQLMKLLGEWDSCHLENYETDEFGTYALIVIEWKNVKLSIENSPPETTIYTVDTSGKSPLNPQWYEQNKKNLINKFFDMNWGFDDFPGPTSEQHLSSEEGTNGQFWAERDKDGNVTWMRFSYAL